MPYFSISLPDFPLARVLLGRNPAAHAPMASDLPLISHPVASSLLQDMSF